jgi:predicted ribosomally synthesized peptide with nif11-like leader
MSTDFQARAFYDEVMTDATLQERLKGATSRASLISIALNLGAERGYDFTADEANSLIDSSMGSLGEQADSVLSDDLLVGVAGGKDKGVNPGTSVPATPATPIPDAGPGPQPPVISV